MGIKIELSYLQPFINGAKAVEVNGSTVGECLEHLVDKFPKLKLFDKDGKLFPNLSIYVNGESTYPEELAKPVKDGDELSILLMLDGG